MSAEELYDIEEDLEPERGDAPLRISTASGMCHIEPRSRRSNEEYFSLETICRLKLRKWKGMLGYCEDGVVTSVQKQQGSSKRKTTWYFELCIEGCGLQSESSLEWP